MNYTIDHTSNEKKLAIETYQSRLYLYSVRHGGENRLLISFEKTLRVRHNYIIICGRI